MMIERERFPHPALMAHEEFIRYVKTYKFKNVHVLLLLYWYQLLHAYICNCLAHKNENKYFYLYL